MIVRSGRSQVKEATESATAGEKSEDKEKDLSINGEHVKILESKKEKENNESENDKGEKKEQPENPACPTGPS